LRPPRSAIPLDLGEGVSNGLGDGVGRVRSLDGGVQIGAAHEVIGFQPLGDGVEQPRDLLIGRRGAGFDLRADAVEPSRPPVPQPGDHQRRERADASRRTDDQHLLSSLDLPRVAKAVQRGHAGDRRRRGPFERKA